MLLLLAEADIHRNPVLARSLAFSCQAFNQFSMLRPILQEKVCPRDLKFIKLEARRYGAPDQAIVVRARALCCEPGAGRNQRLEIRSVVFQWIAEAEDPQPTLWQEDVHMQGGAIIKMPHFVRFDSVPRRPFLAAKQVIDGSGGRACRIVMRALDAFLAAIGFPEMPTFRMRLKCQAGNQFFGAGFGHHMAG